MNFSESPFSPENFYDPSNIFSPLSPLNPINQQNCQDKDEKSPDNYSDEPNSCLIAFSCLFGIAILGILIYVVIAMINQVIQLKELVDAGF